MQDSSPSISPLMAQPLRLGTVQLSHPFLQAALSGYSNWPMRALARDYGAAYTVAEVMIDRFVTEAKPTGRTRHHFFVADSDHPVGAQLMGSDPQLFEIAARRLIAAGFDVIDINFGCPVKTAIGGCRGGYHLSQPEVAREIMQRVRAVVPAPLPVTVKMRRGIDLSERSTHQFFQIFDAAYECGLDAVTVHGRTVEQKYVGPSSWNFLKMVKQHAGHRVVIGSGDLFSAEDCVNMLRETGVDGVSIARGAIGNPWIFSQAWNLWESGTPPMAPSVFQQRTALVKHKSYADQIVPGKSLGMIKKFGFKYARLHPQTGELRGAFQNLRTIEDWEVILETFYSVDCAGRFPEIDESR